MPSSCALLRSLTDRSSSTSPHHPVETVQTPKPTSETSMSVLPSLRYFISFLSSRASRLATTTFYRPCYPPPCVLFPSHRPVQLCGAGRGYNQPDDGERGP